MHSWKAGKESLIRNNFPMRRRIGRKMRMRATRGVCCTKDIVYREGNIGVWDVLGKNPQELVRLSVGKYDPANSRHVYMLEALGITDQDIADLNDER